jgi:hypothetical protein
VSEPGPSTRGLRAIAGLAARATIRSRLAQAALLLTLLAPPVLATQATGDGSAAGRIRALMSWSLDFDMLVLSLTTVFLSTSLASDLRSGRLIQLCSAPIRREAVLVGWWLGCVGVLAALSVFALTSVGLTAGALALLTPQTDREQVTNTLRAQGVVLSDRPDDEILLARVEQSFKDLVTSGRLPPDVTPDEAFERLERAERTRLRTVHRRQTVAWSLRNITPPDSAEALALQFTFRAQSTQNVSLGQLPKIRGAFSFEAPGSDRILAVRGNWAAGKWHTLPVPREVLADGTSVTVSYMNMDERPLVVLFPETGVKVLYPAGGFVANLLRVALVLLGRLAFLAAVGLAFASLIDGRLAAGVVLWFLVLGASVAFLRDSLSPGVLGAADAVLRPLVDGFLLSIPDLGRVDLADAMASGQRVDWEEVGRSLGGDTLLRGGALLGVGSALFGRRELGSIR